MHTGQDRWIQTELAFTLAKNATKPNFFEIISLQTTRKENNWKTGETLARTVVTLETEWIKGSNPWCLLWWWWWRWLGISSEVRKNRTGYETCCTPLYKCYKEYFWILKFQLLTHNIYVETQKQSSCLALTGKKNCTTATNLLKRHSAHKINI
jgi:hypothetical protein